MVAIVNSEIKNSNYKSVEATKSTRCGNWFINHLPLKTSIVVVFFCCVLIMLFNVKCNDQSEMWSMVQIARVLRQLESPITHWMWIVNLIVKTYTWRQQSEYERDLSSHEWFDSVENADDTCVCVWHSYKYDLYLS